MESLSPSIVLAAYAEPLLEGRRVVVFGDATSPLAAELVERGARAVHVYDPEPVRAGVAAARNRSKQISVVPLDEADVAVRDGAFDLAVVEDLSFAKEPATLLKRVRRALAARGAAIVASPNPDVRSSLVPRTSSTGGGTPLGYYELYDAVSSEFPEVRMLGQTPFVGYAIVDFAPEGEPEVSLDSGLVPGGAEEPEWFIALAGRDAVHAEAFSIVQLPASRVHTGSADSDVAGDLRAARSAEARLLERVAVLEAEATALRAEGQKPRPDASKARVTSLETELTKREAWITQLEARATAADARADDVLEELEALKGKSAGSAKAEAELSKIGPERDRLTKQLAAVTAERDAIGRQLAAVMADKGTAGKQLGDVTTDRDAIGKQLAAVTTERDAVGKQLAAVTAERDAIGKQLTGVTTERDAIGKQLAGVTAEKAQATKQLAALGPEKAELVVQLAKRDADLAKLAEEVAARDVQLKKLTAPGIADETDDIARLEAALRERGERIRQLEASVRDAERVGKELVRELRVPPRAPETPPAAIAAPAEPKLAAENARLSADLEAAGWTIQELEARLARAQATAH